MKPNKGIYKFNNGNGAKLCNGCSIIIKTNSTFSKEDMLAAYKGKNTKLNIEYCKNCKIKNMEEINQNLVSFGEAILALNNGKRIARSGWNGKGLFVFRQVPSVIDMSIVPNMQSLPQSVKDEFISRNKFPTYREVNYPDVDPIEFNSIKYKNQLCMVYPDNTIYGWVASPSDVLEEDWIILD